MTTFKVSEKATKSAGTSRPLPKAGSQAARLIHIVDLGVQPRKPFKGKEKAPAAMVWINFELVNDKIEINGEKVTQRISPAKLTVSDDPKSALFKLVNSLDPNNDYKFDLAKLAGLPCLVSVVHAKVETAEGPKTYANFAAATPPPEGFPIPEPTQKPVVVTFEESTLEDVKLVPKFIRAQMREAVNFGKCKIAALLDQADKEDDEAKAEREAKSDKEAY